MLAQRNIDKVEVLFLVSGVNVLCNAQHFQLDAVGRQAEQRGLRFSSEAAGKFSAIQ